MIRLSVTSSTGRSTFLSDRTEILVGSREGADLRIEDAGVARNHCLLRVEGAALTLVDLGELAQGSAGQRRGLHENLPEPVFDIRPDFLDANHFRQAFEKVHPVGIECGEGAGHILVGKSRPKAVRTGDTVSVCAVTTLTAKTRSRTGGRNPCCDCMLFTALKNVFPATARIPRVKDNRNKPVKLWRRNLIAVPFQRLLGAPRGT